MNLYVDEIEALWVVLNLAGAVVALFALVDAYRDKRETRLMNGVARTLTAAGNVRREWFRLIVQLLLLSVVVPGVFSDRATPLSPAVVALMTVPAVLLLASLLDARDRGRLSAITDRTVAAQRNAQIAALSRQIEVGTEVAREAGRASHEAEKAANNTQEKIANLNERLIEQADRTTDEMARTDKHQAIQDERIDERDA